MPTRSAPTRPGPWVTPMASMSRRVRLAFARASRTTGTIWRRCSREASSGTTPPYRRWMSIWEATTLERISRPSATTAAAVSSQEDSMPRIRVGMRDFSQLQFYASTRWRAFPHGPKPAQRLRFVSELKLRLLRRAIAGVASCEKQNGSKYLPLQRRRAFHGEFDSSRKFWTPWSVGLIDNGSEGRLLCGGRVGQSISDRDHTNIYEC